MGLNNENALCHPFYFDIETVANPAAVSMLAPAKAPRNLKDPAKIAAAIAEKEADRLERGALDCDTAQVVAIGMSFPRAYDEHVYDVREWSTEAALLSAFWAEVSGHKRAFPTSPLVGFNCLAYDLPVLYRRSQILGVPSVPLQLGRYRHDGIIDLMQWLSWDGLVEAKKLSVYCRLFGIDVADQHDGSEIAALVAAGDWQAVRDHCRADVLKTKALAERVGAVR